jgi:hypothetical protein
MMRLLARAYLVIVAAAAAWAWYTDITLRNDPSDHMLPDMLLGIASWPTSAAMSHADVAFPQIADRPFIGLIALTLCAAVQAAFLFLLAHFEGRMFMRIEQSRRGDGSQV